MVTNSTFLYANNEISEKEMKKLFCSYNKKNKIPSNKLNKGCGGPIYWTLQTLLKEMEEDTKK